MNRRDSSPARERSQVEIRPDEHAGRELERALDSHDAGETMSDIRIASLKKRGCSKKAIKRPNLK